MPAKHYREELGYSLVEVMAATVIMILAIIPMISMFDMGFHSVSASSNYDKARTFANSQLEQAQNLDYAEVRDNFPVGGSTPDTTNGTFTSADLAVPTSVGLATGSTYTVAKQYIAPPSPDPPSPSEDFSSSTTDQGLIRVTVTVQWQDNEYSTFGLVAQ